MMAPMRGMKTIPPAGRRHANSLLRTVASSGVTESICGYTVAMKKLMHTWLMRDDPHSFVS